MVYRDERSALRETVALDHHKAQTPPELFGVCIEGRSAGDECPELPSREVMNLAKTPPTPDKLLFRRSCKLSLKPSFPSLRLEIAFDLVFDRLNDARDGDNDRDFFFLDGLNDL